MPTFGARLGWGLVLGLLLATLVGPWLVPFGPNTLHLDAVLLPPNGTFWLGTDTLGRDVLSRLLAGAQTSLSVGLVAVGLATGLGVLVGWLGAMGPRWLDGLLMRITDVVLCFPTIFLILAVLAVLEPSLLNVMIVIGLTSWMGTARLVRAELLSLRSRTFVAAAALGGVGRVRVWARHLWPHLRPTIMTSACLGLAGAMLAETGLSYLGLGVQPPTASWGAMLAEGKGVLEVGWWLVLWPGLAIVLTVLGFMLLAERNDD